LSLRSRRGFALNDDMETREDDDALIEDTEPEVQE
jgi:hypothetical protein